MIRLCAAESRRFAIIRRTFDPRLVARRAMSKPYLTHEERTAADYRESGLHTVQLAQVVQATPNIRSLRLEMLDRSRGLQFKPGQWLDVYVPGISKAGGFTITSAPTKSEVNSSNGDVPYFELAVQESPRNPPAAWLWKPVHEILGKELQVRVGGSFTWPPPSTDPSKYQHVLLVAGGVGINPFMSIVDNFHRTNTWPNKVTLLYGSKYSPGSTEEHVVFHNKLVAIAKTCSAFRYYLYVTGNVTGEFLETEAFITRGRITDAIIEDALGSSNDRLSTIAYVCGPQAMTDEFVDSIGRMSNMNADRVLCEKWW